VLRPPADSLYLHLLSYQVLNVAQSNVLRAFGDLGPFGCPSRLCRWRELFVYVCFEHAKLIKNPAKRRLLTKNHHAHFFVILFEGGDAAVGRDKPKTSAPRPIVAGPRRRVEGFLTRPQPETRGCLGQKLSPLLNPKPPQPCPRPLNCTQRLAS